LVLLAQKQEGAKFSLAAFIRRESELCRVMVRDPHLAWARRYPLLVKPNLLAQKEGVAGYELALNFNGLPVELIPRAASEMKTKSRFVLLSVNAPEQAQHPCRWQLAPHGLQLLELLAYQSAPTAPALAPNRRSNQQ
jgi:hypothetical protein